MAIASGSPEAISSAEFLIHLISHSSEYFSLTPLRAGPINTLKNGLLNGLKIQLS
jgi:hypothetical protein